MHLFEQRVAKGLNVCLYRHYFLQCSDASRQ
jgi:hypothetical protein